MPSKRIRLNWGYQSAAAIFNSFQNFSLAPFLGKEVVFLRPACLLDYRTSRRESSLINGILFLKRFLFARIRIAL